MKRKILTPIIVVGLIFVTIFATQNLVDAQIAASEKPDLIFVQYSNSKPQIMSQKSGLVTLNDAVTAENIVSKRIHLSPNRKYLAVTIQLSGNFKVLSYISDLKGNMVTTAQEGSFVSWAPDSRKILLYRSIESTGSEREIYSLDIYNNYTSFGLPNGVIGADISPKDGGVLYALTNSHSDDSSLYIRDVSGNNTLLLEGDKNIFAYPRWSPSGEKITFLKADLLLRPGKQTVWVMNADGSEKKMISPVSWGYPPVWSSDGEKLIFSNGANIFEYDSTENRLQSATNFAGGNAKYPNYTKDGSEIIFISNDTGVDQVWSGGDQTRMLIENGDEKSYPIAP